jgi:hypothetical protein
MLVVSEVYQNYQTGVVSSQLTNVGRGGGILYMDVA